MLTLLESARTKFSTLFGDRRGATAIEYGLIAALIAVVIIGVITFVGEDLEAMFTTVSDNLKPKG